MRIPERLQHAHQLENLGFHNKKPAESGTVIYFTETRLMQESEHTVHERADHGEEISRRVCGQLISDHRRYCLWLGGHEQRMRDVARERRREQQMLKLRGLAVQQVHRAALVRYFREYSVTGERREQTLRSFYAMIDPSRSLLCEHRGYLLAASSQWCASDVLDLAGDKRAVEMIQDYEQKYGQYFAMFCDRARSTRSISSDLLSALIPEAKAKAERLRQRILAGEHVPVRRVAARFHGLSAR